MSLHELIPILQIAVGPVILISGVGLLLLSMTNRFGRVIDRSRDLAIALRGASTEERAVVQSEIAILVARASLLRRAIVLAIVSVLCASALVITVFLAAVLRWERAGAIVTLFIGCMATLIASLIVFLQDINLSLGALRLELGSVPPPETRDVR